MKMFIIFIFKVIQVEILITNLYITYILKRHPPLQCFWMHLSLVLFYLPRGRTECVGGIFLNGWGISCVFIWNEACNFLFPLFVVLCSNVNRLNNVDKGRPSQESIQCSYGLYKTFYCWVVICKPS